MRRILYIITIAVLFITSCDVHEWPDLPETVPCHIKLNYNTNFTKWNHIYNNSQVIEEGFGETYDNQMQYGQIRYIVRTYPITDNNVLSQNYTQEFTFVKDIAEGYDFETTLEVIPGDYNVMVWSDLVQTQSNEHFYNATNFVEIKLQGTHYGNNNWRDSFRGAGEVSLKADILDDAPDSLSIQMQRPMGKYEFITTDLQEFMRKELEFLTKEAATKGDQVPTRVNTENYKVVFLYAPYMQNTYNMFADKPIDVSEGIYIESKLNIIDENNASIGFDYVFTNPFLTYVAVQIGFYDDKDRQIALSNPINVPLNRDYHTILRGSFLMQQAQGGIVIDPSFNGNHNIVIP